MGIAEVGIESGVSRLATGRAIHRLDLVRSLSLRSCRGRTAGPHALTRLFGWKCAAKFKAIQRLFARFDMLANERVLAESYRRVFSKLASRSRQLDECLLPLVRRLRWRRGGRGDTRRANRSGGRYYSRLWLSPNARRGQSLGQRHKRAIAPPGAQQAQSQRRAGAAGQRQADLRRTGQPSQAQKPDRAVAIVL